MVITIVRAIVEQLFDSKHTVDIVDVYRDKQTPSNLSLIIHWEK